MLTPAPRGFSVSELVGCQSVSPITQGRGQISGSKSSGLPSWRRIWIWGFTLPFTAQPPQVSVHVHISPCCSLQGFLDN